MGFLKVDGAVKTQFYENENDSLNRNLDKSNRLAQGFLKHFPQKMYKIKPRNDQKARATGKTTTSPEIAFVSF